MAQLDQHAARLQQAAARAERSIAVLQRRLTAELLTASKELPPETPRECRRSRKTSHGSVSRVPSPRERSLQRRAEQDRLQRRRELEVSSARRSTALSLKRSRTQSAAKHSQRTASQRELQYALRCTELLEREERASRRLTCVKDATRRMELQRHKLEAAAERRAEALRERRAAAAARRAAEEERIAQRDLQDRAAERAERARRVKAAALLAERQRFERAEEEQRVLRSSEAAAQQLERRRANERERAAQLEAELKEKVACREEVLRKQRERERLERERRRHVREARAERRRKVQNERVATRRAEIERIRRKVDADEEQLRRMREVRRAGAEAYAALETERRRAMRELKQIGDRISSDPLFVESQRGHRLLGAVKLGANDKMPRRPRSATRCRTVTATASRGGGHRARPKSAGARRVGVGDSGRKTLLQCGLCTHEFSRLPGIISLNTVIKMRSEWGYATHDDLTKVWPEARRLRTAPASLYSAVPLCVFCLQRFRCDE